MDAMSSNYPVAQGSKKNLAEVIERSMIDYFSWVHSCPYSKVEDEPDFLRLMSGIPHPLMNCVFRTRVRSQESDERINTIMSVFKSSNLPMMWFVGPCCQPSDLGQRLESHGLVHETDVVGMSIDMKALNEDLPVPSDLVIKRVANENDMQSYLKVFGTGYEFPDFATTGWGKMDSYHGFGAKHPRTNYVGTVDGAPVGITALFKTSDCAGIFCVATVPQMRRKGIATALVTEALRDARDDGHKMGALQAKAMGAGVYRKIGFVDQPCKIGWYMWIPPSAPH